MEVDWLDSCWTIHLSLGGSVMLADKQASGLVHQREFDPLAKCNTNISTEKGTEM